MFTKLNVKGLYLNIQGLIPRSFVLVKRPQDCEWECGRGWTTNRSPDISLMFHECKGKDYSFLVLSIKSSLFLWNLEYMRSS